MAKNKIIIKNWPKYLLQWGVLATLIIVLVTAAKGEADPETYCPAGGIQAFVTYLVRGSLPCSMSSVQIMMGLALVAAVVLFSKLFCGYICPIGTVEDLLSKLRKVLHIKSINIENQGVADKILRIFKYGLLFWIFYSTATASELFCKNLDPYYAVATGFKGEITLWMSLVTLGLVVLFGFFIDNFWCRYICPLGAVSNSFKFWVWCIVLFGLWWVLALMGTEMPWWILLAAFCLMGYLLEILCGNPRFQILHVQKDMAKCNRCGVCTRECPYHIAVDAVEKRVTSVDCTLCGDCVASCRTNALHVGICSTGHKNILGLILPAVLVVALAAVGIILGSRKELPTINETWGIYSEDSLHTQLVDPSTLETTMLTGLKQVHCYGSSRAFMGKLMKIKGVYGVKTYVKSHRALVTYDPARITPEKIQEEIYVPSKFKCLTPDYKAVPMVKVLTIRTEHMPAGNDVNLLGIQFKQFDLDSLIYGLDSQWDCPLVVHMYVDPAFDKDKEWIKSIVEKPTLDLPRHDGTIKSTPLGFEFVRLEKNDTLIPTTEFLKAMFSNPFKAEFAKRVKEAEGKKQKVYEIADELFTKPLISRGLPFVSNHLSKEDGIIGVYTKLNADYIPSLQIRYCAPMTDKRIWELLTMEEWTITYSKDDVRTVPAKIKFKRPGIVYPWKEPVAE